MESTKTKNFKIRNFPLALKHNPNFEVRNSFAHVEDKGENVKKFVRKKLMNSLRLDGSNYGIKPQNSFGANRQYAKSEFLANYPTKQHNLRGTKQKIRKSKNSLKNLFTVKKSLINSISQTSKKRPNTQIQ
jgi:hypothetical protein